MNAVHMSKNCFTHNTEADRLSWRNTAGIATETTYYGANQVKPTVSELNRLFTKYYKAPYLDHYCMACTIEHVLDNVTDLSADTKHYLASMLEHSGLPERLEENSGFSDFSLSDDIQAAVLGEVRSLSVDQLKKLRVTPVRATEGGGDVKGVPHLRHLPGCGCSRKRNNISPESQAHILRPYLIDQYDSSLEVNVHHAQVNRNTFYMLDVCLDGEVLNRHYLFCETGKANYHSDCQQLIKADAHSNGAPLSQTVVITNTLPRQGYAFLMRHWIHTNELPITVTHFKKPIATAEAQLESTSTASSLPSVPYYSLVWSEDDTDLYERRQESKTYGDSSDYSCRTQRVKAEVAAEPTVTAIDSEQTTAFKQLLDGLVDSTTITNHWLLGMNEPSLRQIAKRLSDEPFVVEARHIIRQIDSDVIGQHVDAALLSLRLKFYNLTPAIRKATEIGKVSPLSAEDIQLAYLGCGLAPLIQSVRCWTNGAIVVYAELIDAYHEQVKLTRQKIANKIGTTRADHTIAGRITAGLLKLTSVNKQGAGAVAVSDMAAITDRALNGQAFPSKRRNQISKSVSPADLDF